MNDKRLGEWYDVLPQPFLDDEMLKIGAFLTEERKKYKVLPEAGSELTFKAFRLTPFSKVKVVIIGQDK